MPEKIQHETSIYLVYLNALITTAALFIYIISFLFVRYSILESLFLKLYSASLIWFIISLFPAAVQTSYGLANYIKTKENEILHNLCSPCLVGADYLILMVLFNSGYYLKA